MQIAAFSQHRNDLYWSIYNRDDGTIRWGGYDDANWWNNVSHLPHTYTRVGKNSGRIYIIQFDTRVVIASEGNITT